MSMYFLKSRLSHVSRRFAMHGVAVVWRLPCLPVILDFILLVGTLLFHLILLACCTKLDYFTSYCTPKYEWPSKQQQWNFWRWPYPVKNDIAMPNYAQPLDSHKSLHLSTSIYDVLTLPNCNIYNWQFLLRWPDIVNLFFKTHRQYHN